MVRSLFPTWTSTAIWTCSLPGWVLRGLWPSYTNAGSGRFAERTGTPFECVYFGSATFADIDGDGDQDLLLTGTNSSGALSKLYVNDGQGRFSEKSGALFEGVYLSAAAFADVDGDKDPDAFLTGRNSAGLRVAKLYLNDGQGHFSEKPGTPFVGVYDQRPRLRM